MPRNASFSSEDMTELDLRGWTSSGCGGAVPCTSLSVGAGAAQRWAAVAERVSHPSRATRGRT